MAWMEAVDARILLYKNSSNFHWKAHEKEQKKNESIGKVFPQTKFVRKKQGQIGVEVLICMYVCKRYPLNRKVCRKFDMTVQFIQIVMTTIQQATIGELLSAKISETIGGFRNVIESKRGMFVGFGGEAIACTNHSRCARYLALPSDFAVSV